ncbi:FmdB family transcriptional regulator [Methylosinus sp. R-45379]|jgi:putative FmdB family regulatory protein|uniref:FmdB family zinc ribbon protein n=1 Tax=unclassified Methylosinus TaxID=2624500 RepID=UPI000462EE9E|nr:MULTISPECIES: zinc ribbon domain-containing protein [unclassified Methylosinus]OAI24853.1 FmdB family transcriptional regulator [Methylosinus sp. R-45379]TDX66894.1 putative FmdB family regulatory protein [Methylosinus sp. sav-2]
MPLYSYECQDCHAEFELLISASDTPVCPSCGSEKLQQQVAKICVEIKYPAIARSWRKAAAAEGELSNFSKKEIEAKPKS